MYTENGFDCDTKGSDLKRSYQLHKREKCLSIYINKIIKKYLVDKVMGHHATWIISIILYRHLMYMQNS